MATSGSFNTAAYEGRYLQFSWSIPDGGQDIAGNKTKINWTLKGAGTGEAGYYLSGNFKVVIDGTTVYQSASRIQLYNGTVVASGSVTLSHSGDGTRSFSASAEAGIYYVDVNCRGSGSWSLPTIARASVLSYVGDITLGNKCNIKWVPKHKSFGYRMRFTLGYWTFLTEAIVPGTTAEYTYAGYVIPMEVAEQFTASKTGTMTVALYTYTDSTCSTQIGSPSVGSFTVTVPQSAAPIAAMALAPVNSLGSPFNTLYIQGKTRVQADFSGSKAQYEAGIKSYSLAVAGAVDSTSPYQSNLLGASGSVTVKGTVTDSRGYSSVIAKTVDVIQYSSPAVIPYTGESKVICARCDANGKLDPSGTYLRVKAGRKYSKVESGGAQKNFCTLGYRYAVTGGSYPSAFSTLIGKDASSADTIDTILNLGLAVTSSYSVQLCVTDDVGESSTITFAIPSEQVTFMLKQGGKGAAFGKYAEEDDLLDVAWNLKAHKGVNGAYIKSFRVYGTDYVNIQTKYSDFSGAGNNRQTIFMFGADNHILINGIITVNNSGSATWTGSGDVTTEAVDGGIIKITLPTAAYDYMVAISPEYFEII